MREKWNERYSGDEYVFGTEPNAFLASQGFRLKPGMTCLSVADGEGRNSVWLAKQGLDVTAIDFSSAGIAKAQKLAVRNGVSVHYELADVLAWNWGRERFDVVVAIFIQFATPEERAELFRHMQEALKPGGLLILQGYTPKQAQFKTGGPPETERLYTEDLLRDAFRQMDILHLRDHEEVLNEGKRHSGQSAVIDLVAQKPVG
jgi:2-polyprenyl-3-methyl-5-hydroxy-6-metoxy-1,4-benzoquinol methylase